MMFAEDYLDFDHQEAQAEAVSGLPQICDCGELVQDCDCARADMAEADKERLMQLRAWGYGILTQNESDELKKLEAIEGGEIKITAPTNLTPADLAYWQQRALILLGQPVTIIIDQ